MNDGTTTTGEENGKFCETVGTLSGLLTYWMAVK